MHHQVLSLLSLHLMQIATSHPIFDPYSDQAYNPQEVLVKAHKVCREMSIQHATIQVQDASSTNKQECLSDMCAGEGTCVMATPSSYQSSGF